MVAFYQNRGGWAGPTILLTSTKWSQKCPTPLCGVVFALYLTLFGIAIVFGVSYYNVVYHIYTHRLTRFL